MSLENKRILITAGPTWVPIDSVRVISNIATGTTGILLAEKLQTQGAKVTLLLGPQEACCLNKRIRLIRFNFFNELKNIISKELKSKKYDVMIHSAAVSDYRPKISYRHKVKSGIKHWKLNLTPTPKIIDLIKKIYRSLFLVGFKFEPQATKKMLIEETKSLISRAKLDLAVANTIHKSKYRAYIINNYNQTYGPLLNKKILVEKLINLIRGNL
jgi:phosphopantothenoylcysteine decarboxylase/phosphopantothenate--cysteine ligase